MSDTTNVVLAGVGGQGILLASEVMARAAMAAGHEVKTNEVHGMAQRGGSVIAQVRYGSEVHSPLVPEGGADVIASFEKVEALRYAHYLKAGALAVVADYALIPTTVSSGLATYPEDVDDRLRRVFPRLGLIDAVRIATGLGNFKAANIVVMGGLSRGIELPEEAWKEGIHKAVKPKFVELNLQAFEAGRQAVAELDPVEA
ncbi:MAG: indolepyruvate oxidoreductase subunit beta [Phycisphaeraceae bacterium]